MLNTRKEAMKNTYSPMFLFAKGYRTNYVGVKSGTVCKDIRPGTGFKTGEFEGEKLAGLSQYDSTLAVE